LSARILKASYFPNGSILDVELGSRASQVWRTVLEGRDIMKQGIIRRIGSGQDTDIWADNWIPKSSSLRPIISLVPAPPTKVSELLNISMATWNVDLVRSVFIPFDADDIFKDSGVHKKYN
jgi:hypothetical protein